MLEESVIGIMVMCKTILHKVYKSKHNKEIAALSNNHNNEDVIN